MSRYNDDGVSGARIAKGISGLVLFFLMLTALGMWGCPKYSVYEQNLEGEAELARASQNRQIKVQESLAQKEAALNLKAASITRAEGEAEANKILGNSLAGEKGERYLCYLYIHALESGQHDVIYVPTEAGLPILEAGRGSAHPFPQQK